MRLPYGHRLREVEQMTQVGSENVSAAPAIEKVMTLSQSEYAKSITAFAGQQAGQAAATGEPVVLAVGKGQAVITFAKIAGFSFSGLVELPRARVVIEFNDVCKADADDLLRRFDIAFQRGGG